MLFAFNLLVEPELQSVAEPAYTSVWSAARIAVYLAALGVIGLGIRLILLGRSRSKTASASGSQSEDLSHGGFGWFGGLSAATQIVIGMGLILLAYHAAAWMSPESWFALQFPRERWWAVFVLVGVAIAGSLWSERLERAG